MINWNKEFTALVRETRPTCWGNWGLNNHIQAGAVGIVDPKTGDFKLVRDRLPKVELIEVAHSQTWEMRSSTVKKTELKPESSLSFKDPQTGIDLKADSKIQWTFGSSGAMASEFAVVKEVRINDLTQLNKQFTWLAEQASQVGFGSKTSITQGFGVITNVIYAASGMNVGSKEKNSSFSMTGNARALNTMLGSMAPEASISGSFTSTLEDKSLDKHIWPATTNTASTAPIPIAYTFTSFEGDMIIPNWVNKLGSFELEVNSKFGSTYSAKVVLEYDTPSGPKVEKALVVGGQNQTFSAIPLTATNVKLEVNFVGLTSVPAVKKHWATPLGQWINGKRRIELSGVWPFKAGVTVLEEDN